PDFRIVQADLARTLEALAAYGSRPFYRGPRAAAIVAAVRARGGVLDAADLARYRPRWRRPLAGAFRGRRIVTFPPPGSGGVLLEMLGLLARDDLPALGRGTPTALHLLAGTMAQAFADRARWYGAPECTRVPVGALLAPPRLAGRRPALVVGGSGGPTIISGTLQVMLGVLAFGLPLREAVVAPRVHDQATPPVLAVEAGVEPSVRGVLERLGHRVVVAPTIGAVSA